MEVSLIIGSLVVLTHILRNHTWPIECTKLETTLKLKVVVLSYCLEQQRNILSFFVVVVILFCFVFVTGSCYAAQATLKLKILLSQWVEGL
jgi:hypothetical protein